MSILSIQSSVAYGYAGNSAAVFPLQRLGIEVWPVHTVHFSNHTGYGETRGPVLRSSDVADVITGVEERGAMPDCDAVLSGYQGAEDIGAVILDAVRRVKSHNPKAIYCCDPVMGDVGRGFFVRPGIPELIRDKAVPAADIITPNHFELNFLSDTETTTLGGVLGAIEKVRGLGPPTVLVTSVVRRDGPQGTLEMIAVSPAGAWSVSTPHLPITAAGSGDVTAALFLAHTLDTGDLAIALGRTASTVFTILEATVESGRREMALVAAQDAIAHPAMRFEVNRLR